MREFFVNIGDFFVRLYTDLINFDRWYLDIIDIVLVAVILYYIIKFVRETRAAQLVKAILLFFVVFLVSSLLELTTISFLLEYVFQYGLVAIAIIFQPEIRRGLEKIGRSNFRLFNVISKQNLEDSNSKWKYSIDPICEACYRLSCDKTGALIVIERTIRLGESVERAVVIDSVPSVSLITNIFFTNSPLHDGGLIVRDGRLFAASCFFQPSDKVENISLGSRHRAALGVSEVSDAIVIIVSEETGIISIATEGKLIRDFTKESLKDYLAQNLLQDELDENGKPIQKKQNKIKSVLGRRNVK
ncbi:MAG: diadenylate cyclase CdaA [Oscillospiraceae bacterium]|nr:diadenylate cyclase CdaA [Oscillospiraceae bacterium]